jgi:hypothetical protein
VIALSARPSSLAQHGLRIYSESRFDETFARLVATFSAIFKFRDMKLDELRREAERLTPEERRKLIGFLVSIDIWRDRAELTQRLNDQSFAGWISLTEAERRLKSDGL